MYCVLLHYSTGTLLYTNTILYTTLNHYTLHCIATALPYTTQHSTLLSTAQSTVPANTVCLHCHCHCHCHGVIVTVYTVTVTVTVSLLRLILSPCQGVIVTCHFASLVTLLFPNFPHVTPDRPTLRLMEWIQTSVDLRVATTKLDSYQPL